MKTTLIIVAVCASAFLVVLALRLLFSRRTKPDPERLRRDYIHAVGRVTDGTVLDAHNEEDDGSEAQLIVYRYDVGGVSYESSQDVTRLRHRVDLHTCRIGLPASVKYDPQNPGNSVVITELWSGLRL